MTEDPGPYDPALIDHHIAAVMAAPGRIDDGERVASSRWLLEMLRRQLRAGTVHPHLANHFAWVIRSILSIEDAGTEAGRILGLTRGKGPPSRRETVHVDIATEVERQFRAGATGEQPFEKVAGSRPGWHMTPKSVKRIYLRHRIAARAALAFEQERREHLAWLGTLIPPNCGD
jgi:hypothetical protein